MSDAASLTPEQRVQLMVGGNFTKDALGRVADDILHEVDGDPLGHLRAFQRLYLSGRPSRRALTELFLGSFLQRIARTHPAEARAAAQALERLMTSLARAQESEAVESTDFDRSREIARQRRQLAQRREALARI